jgi:hypothetical protein
MESNEFWTFLINAILFFLAFKLGQISVHVRYNQQNQIETSRNLAVIRQTGQRPVITVEEINGIFYAYDGNDFLAQGPSPDELGKSIANRFPNKYHLARVEIKPSTQS